MRDAIGLTATVLGVSLGNSESLIIPAMLLLIGIALMSGKEG